MQQLFFSFFYGPEASILSQSCLTESTLNFSTLAILPRSCLRNAGTLFYHKNAETTAQKKTKNNGQKSEGWWTECTIQSGKKNKQKKRKPKKKQKKKKNREQREKKQKNAKKTKKNEKNAKKGGKKTKTKKKNAKKTQKKRDAQKKEEVKNAKKKQKQKTQKKPKKKNKKKEGKRIKTQKKKGKKRKISENSGTPKSSILIGFSIINHPFWGTPIFGNTHMDHGSLLQQIHAKQKLELKAGPTSAPKPL